MTAERMKIRNPPRGVLLEERLAVLLGQRWLKDIVRFQSVTREEAGCNRDHKIRGKSYEILMKHENLLAHVLIVNYRII